MREFVGMAFLGFAAMHAYFAGQTIDRLDEARDTAAIHVDAATSGHAGAPPSAEHAYELAQLERIALGSEAVEHALMIVVWSSAGTTVLRSSEDDRG